MATREAARKRHVSAAAIRRGPLLASRSVEKRSTAIGRLVATAEAVSMAGAFGSRVPALATEPIASGADMRLVRDESTKSQ